MASWNSPALPHKIQDDIPFLQAALHALLRMDPTPLTDVPGGAVRLAELNTDVYQLQKYTGTEWASMRKLLMDVESVGGYTTSIASAPHTVAVRNQHGEIEGTLKGNASTATTAAGLSNTLPVAQGGTGAETAAQARANLNVPASNHSSMDLIHGGATSTLYGHVKLSDIADDALTNEHSVAATPAAVHTAQTAAEQAAEQAARAAQAASEQAIAAQQAATTPATTDHVGVMKPGAGLVMHGDVLDMTAATPETIGGVLASPTAKAGAVPVMNDEGKLDETIVPKADNTPPLGTYLLSLSKKAPAGALPCDGSLFTKSLYQDLFDLMTTNGDVVPEAQWQETAAANNGYCAQFADNGGTFRTPKPAPHIMLALLADSVGEHTEAGLPNIEGNVHQTDSDANKGGWLNYNPEENDVNSALYLKDRNSSSENYQSPSWTTDENISPLYFDASRSNPIYGNSTTVQPETTSFRLYVQAVGSVTVTGDVTTDQILTTIEQSLNPASKDLSGTVKLSDAIDDPSDVSSGTAATPAAVKAVYDQVYEKATAAFLKPSGIPDFAEERKSEHVTGTLEVSNPDTQTAVLKGGYYYVIIFSSCQYSLHGRWCRADINGVSIYEASPVYNSDRGTACVPLAADATLSITGYGYDISASWVGVPFIK